MKRLFKLLASFPWTDMIFVVCLVFVSALIGAAIEAAFNPYCI